MLQVMKKLVSIRRSRMTAAQVARSMGVSRQQVCNIEKGYQGDPSLRTFVEYAKAVGVKIVLNGVDDGNSSGA
jgi:DNA-binding XRE family transcriptional regulator